MSEQDVHYPFPGEQEFKEAGVPFKEAHSNGNGMMAVRYSAELGGLAEALAKAQLEFTPVLKQSENPAFRRGRGFSKYADLSAVIDATRPALAKHGLVVIQLPQVDQAGKMLKMTTKLLHSSGQWIENDLIVPATMQNRFDIQSIGSAMTYTRRYALQAIVGVAAEDDDDGNAAAGVGSADAQQAIAEKKIADSGVVPSLFFIWHDDSQTAEITGAESLKTANRELLKRFWNPTVGALVVNGEQLEELKYEFEQRKVPFSRLGPPPLTEQLKASVEKVAKSKKV